MITYDQQQTKEQWHASNKVVIVHSLGGSIEVLISMTLQQH